MMTRVSTLTIAGLLSFLLVAGLSTPVNADYDYYTNRLSREHRIASNVDEWIERGNATITASPRFDDGVRLTAWANNAQNTNDYEFAIASAVYLFEIPQGTQYIELLVRYKGEPHQIEIEDYEEPIAGRAWIRNTKRESTRRGYHDENADETRYGDTFVLRAKNRSELIKIPATGHVKNGWMELHIVAEGGEQIDVEYIEVSTYNRQPKIRVIQRYTPTYRWRPWHRYTYLYFYDGPVYYATDSDYYLRWSYPIYDHRYLSIRSHYGGYLGYYHTHYPSAYYRCYSPYYGAYRGTPKVYQRRTQLNRWSARHESTRRQYSRSRLAANIQRGDRIAVRNTVRTTLENHRRQTPATTARVTRESIISRKQRALAPTSALQRSHVRQNSYTARPLDKQRRYPTSSRVDTNRYRRSTSIQRTAPLYKRSTASTNRSFSSSSSSTSRTKYRSSTTRSSTSSRSSTKSSVSRSSSSTPRTKSRVSRTSSSRQRATTSSSSSSRSSSSSKDDDENRSRTTERTKRRR